MTPIALPKALQIWEDQVGVTVTGDAPICTSRWALEARRIIRGHVLTRHALVPDQTKSFLKELCGKYPFGERRAWPYKMWRAEVRVLEKLLRETPHLRLTDEQCAIVEIARDRELSDDRAGAAAILLAEDIPYLEVGLCGVCGAAPGSSCHNLDALVFDTPAQPSLFAAIVGAQHPTLVVPHAARYKD